MTLNACDMKYSKPNVYGKATWYGIFDSTQGSRSVITLSKGAVRYASRGQVAGDHMVSYNYAIASRRLWMPDLVSWLWWRCGE
jgi:hypothetical protein